MVSLFLFTGEGRPSSYISDIEGNVRRYPDLTDVPAVSRVSTVGGVPRVPCDRGGVVCRSE